MSNQIDFDLSACLQENPQPFGVEEVEKVLAVIEGENDGPDWHWVLKLTGDRWVYLRGGCDYTGWDCQSWAGSVFLSPDMPLSKAVEQVRPDYEKESSEFVTELQRQLKEGKVETWREQKDRQFGLSGK